MRSKKSFFSGMICKKNITHFWPVWVLYTIFLFCMVPLQIMLRTGADYIGYAAEDVQWIKKYNYICTLFSSVDTEGTGLVCISLIAGMTVAVCVFSYMYLNKSSHMFHSFPLTRTQLFLSNYISGLIMLIVPLLINFVCTVVVCVFCGITYLEYLGIWLFIMVGESFFFYSMTILVGMFTGRLIAVPIFTVILNFLYIGCRYLITSLSATIGYGLSDSYANRRDSILSPIMYLNDKVWAEGDYQAQTLEFTVHGLKYVAIYTGVAVVFSVLAYLMYRKRRLEMTGELLSVAKTKPIFRWGCALCGAALVAVVLNGAMNGIIHSPQANFTQVILTAGIVGVLIFFVVQMLFEKKFWIFTKARLAECGALLGVVLVFMIAIECDVLGLERKIPDIEDVASIRVSMYYDVEETNVETITDIMDIHRQIMDSKKEFETFAGSNYNQDAMRRVEFDYTMKNGESMVRSYWIPISSAYMENKDSVASGLYAFYKEPDRYLKGHICLNYDDVRIEDMELEIYDKDLEYRALPIQSTDAQKVYDAYIMDIEEGHMILDETIEGGEALYYFNSLYVGLYHKSGVQVPWGERLYWDSASDYYYSTYLYLNTKCTNTISVLTKLGYLNEENRMLTEEEFEARSARLYGEEY